MFALLAAVSLLIPQADLATVEALLAPGRTLADCERAVALVRPLVAASPDDGKVAGVAANALLCVIRIRTDGNHPLLDRTNDTDDNKRVWRALAPEALALAATAKRAAPTNPDALALYAEAYMFNAVSTGIVEAFVKGTARDYVKNADALLPSKTELAVGHVFRASYFTVAPWPICDQRQALDDARAAVRLFPRSVRNQYTLGVVAGRQRKAEEARSAFRAAVEGECTTAAERDVCAFLKREAKRALGLL
jgi:hypothetical protein